MADTVGFGGFFGSAGGMNESYAEDMLNRLNAGQRLLDERPGTLEAVVKAAWQANRAITVAQVVEIINRYFGEMDRRKQAKAAQTVPVSPKPGGAAGGPITPRDTGASAAPAVVEVPKIEVRAERVEVAAPPAATPLIPGWMREAEPGSPAARRMAEIIEESRGAPVARRPGEPPPLPEIVGYAGMGDIPGEAFDAAAAAMKRDAAKRRADEEADRARRVLDADYPAVHAARRAMEAARAAKENEEARRAIDPEYAQRQADVEGKAALERGQRYVGFGRTLAQGVGVPGGEALGNVAGGAAQGFAVAGPWGAAAGAAAAGIGELKRAAIDAGQTVAKFGEAALGADAEGLARGFADLAKKVPIVGDVLGAAANSFLDLTRAADQEARRLSQYNSTLAEGIAQIDVRRLQYDIGRADRQAPELLATAQARADLDMKLLETSERFMPLILNSLTRLLKLAEDGLDGLEKLAELGLRIAEASAAALPEAGGIRAAVRNLLDPLRRLVQNTDPARLQAEADARDFTTQLIETLMPEVARQEGRRATQDAQRDRILQQLQPMFPGF